MVSPFLVSRLSIRSVNALKFVLPSDIPGAWDAFVQSHPAGNVFHLSGMHRAFNDASKYASLAVGAVDACGDIQAMIVPVRVDTGTSLTRKFTSRAVMFGEPLCYPNETSIEATRRLLEHHDSTVSRDVLFTEIRSLRKKISDCPILADSGYEPKSFCNYIVDLSLSQDDLWSKIGKQMRGNISRSQRRGIVIETGNSRELVERARLQIQRSHRRSIVPTPRIDLFESVQRHLGDVLQVRVATYEGADVAGTIGLAWNDRFFSWFGGTSRPSALHPFACIVWDEIKWAHDHGFRYYDFGGAGDVNCAYGPREFKSRFHGELVHYGRCCKVHSPRLLAIAEGGYRSLKRIAGTK